jgi:hypothetical protein
MGQRHLGDLTREIRALGCPVTERRPKTVHRRVIAAYPSHQHQQRHI